MGDGKGAALTRRGLLVGIGAAGGAGAMYAAMGALGLAPSAQSKEFTAPARATSPCAARVRPRW
ncbi:hypothetical protein ACFQYP_61895 [Nonomuraea antimicrobica]